jgi:hypothetical protein
VVRRPGAAFMLKAEFSEMHLSIKLSTKDLLALASMKNAAKREMYCESQNIVNHRIFERTLRLP